MKKCILLLLLSFFLVEEQSSAQTVSTQRQFDDAMGRVRKGEPVSITIKPGTYVLSQPVVANESLSIIGEDAIITSYTDIYSKRDAVRETSDHYVCKLKTIIGEFGLMVNQDGKIVNVSESVDESTLVNMTSSIDGDRKCYAGMSFRIPIPSGLSHLKNISFKQAFGYFDCGWSCVNFKLSKADGKFLYCETLNSTSAPRIDYEMSSYKKDIRFVIYNAEVKAGAVYYDDQYIYIPKSVNCLKVKDCSVFDGSKPAITTNSDLTLSGVTFDGIEGIQVNSDEKEVCSISGCLFTHTLGNTMTLSKKNGNGFISADVSDCRFEECSLLGDSMLVLSSPFSNTTCIYVRNCIFARYPDSKVRYKNPSAMVTLKADAEMSDCSCWNTCRCHIYLWKGYDRVLRTTIYNTKEFNMAKERNLSNDWGLIYVDHIYSDGQQAIANVKHRAVIDGCFLTGAYAYGGDARGIMIDDGRGDVTCINNVVIDCQSYSIDSREVKSFIGTSSIRNVLENNILGCRYRLAGGAKVPEKDRPVSRGNVMLSEYDNVVNENTVDFSSGNVLPYYAVYDDGKIYVERRKFRSLKKTGCYETIKDRIVIK